MEKGYDPSMGRNLSDWLLSESGTTWNSWNWGATWREKISHTSQPRCECFLELSDSFQFKPGGSYFPSLISRTSGLSACFTDSYLQNFLLPWTWPRWASVVPRGSILVPAYHRNPSTQSTWSSILGIWLLAFWRCRDKKCKSNAKLLLCY